MSRRRRQGLSPSLFPFLAVLVCTLGTLILLLALVAQNATETAEQNARAERMAEADLQAPEEKSAAPRITVKIVQSMLKEERFRVEQLVAFRHKQTADMEDRRDQLAHLDDHLQRLRQQLKRLSDEVDHAMGPPKAQQIDDQLIEELRRRINAQRDAIEKLKSDSQRKTPRVVIVPHKGPNGTDRRPVYLECSNRGVTIWPEGSQITMTQLEDASYSANPLDAALRVVRLHAMKHYGDTAPPYPLLVVRPDGIESYAAARRAMQDWDDQFGYELVPANIQLAFSKPDADLKQRVELAILEAAANQHARHAVARRGIGGGSALRHRGPLAGASDRRMPTLSAAALDRAGRSSGFRSHRDDYAIGSSPLGQSPYTSGAPYTSGSQYGQLRGNQYMQDSYGGDGNGAAERRLADEMRAAADPMRDQAGDGHQADSAGDTATSAGQSGPQPSPGEGDLDLAMPSQDGSPPEIDRRIATKQTSPRRSHTPPGKSEQSAMGHETQPPGADSSTAMMSPQQGSESSSKHNASDAGAPPRVNANLAPSQQLVRRQGRDWALPAEIAGMGGNAIVRTIRVQCYPDRFVLLPAATGGATEMFGFSSGDVERATLRLATAVRDRVRRWGPALPGGRWHPRLDVIVMPRGEIRFHQLRTLMNGSGVEVAGRASP